MVTLDSHIEQGFKEKLTLSRVLWRWYTGRAFDDKEAVGPDGEAFFQDWIAKKREEFGASGEIDDDGKDHAVRFVSWLYRTAPSYFGGGGNRFPSDVLRQERDRIFREGVTTVLGYYRHMWKRYTKDVDVKVLGEPAGVYVDAFIQNMD